MLCQKTIFICFTYESRHPAFDACISSKINSGQSRPNDASSTRYKYNRETNIAINCPDVLPDNVSSAGLLLGRICATPNRR